MSKKTVIQIVITLVLLSYLGYKVQWNQITQALADVKLLPCLISYFLLLPSSILITIRTVILLKPTVLNLSITRLLLIQYTSQFYSMFLPSGIGFALVRWYKVTRNRTGRRLFIVVTVLERVMFLMVMFLSVIIAFIFLKDTTLQPLRTAILPSISLLFIFGIIFFMFFLNRRAYQWFSHKMKWIQARFKTPFIRTIFGIYEDSELYQKNKGLFFKAFISQGIFQAVNLLRFYFVFMCLHVTIPFWAIICISTIMQLLQFIPISFAGMGVRESGFAFFLSLYGIEPEIGVLIGVVLSSHIILNSLIGAILTFFEAKEETLVEEERKVEQKSCIDTFI